MWLLVFSFGSLSLLSLVLFYVFKFPNRIIAVKSTIIVSEIHYLGRKYKITC